MSESDLDLFDTNIPVPEPVSESATEEPSLSVTSSQSTQPPSGWSQEVIVVIVILSANSGSVRTNKSKKTTIIILKEFILVISLSQSLSLPRKSV